MLRKNIRLRKEYLYSKNKELKERESTNVNAATTTPACKSRWICSAGGNTNPFDLDAIKRGWGLTGFFLSNLQAPVTVL